CYVPVLVTFRKRHCTPTVCDLASSTCYKHCTPTVCDALLTARRARCIECEPPSKSAPRQGRKVYRMRTLEIRAPSGVQGVGAHQHRQHPLTPRTPDGVRS